MRSSCSFYTIRTKIQDEDHLKERERAEEQMSQKESEMVLHALPENLLNVTPPCIFC